MENDKTFARVASSLRNNDLCMAAFPRKTPRTNLHQRRTNKFANVQSTHQFPRRRGSVIIGKAASSKLRTVYPMRQRCIFVTRLAPETKKSDISSHIELYSGVKPTQVEKLQTKFNTYASFKITCDNPTHNAMMNVHAWPRNALVRDYYQSRS